MSSVLTDQKRVPGCPRESEQASDTDQQSAAVPMVYQSASAILTQWTGNEGLG